MDRLINDLVQTCEVCGFADPSTAYVEEFSRKICDTCIGSIEQELVDDCPE